MNEPPDRRDAPASIGKQARARPDEPLEAMRSVLTRLLQDVVQAEHRLDGNQAAQLLQANEQLVLTALSAQTQAETAAGALDDISRSAELDALTGLPNRARLLDRFAHAIARAKRHFTRVALLFLDLENFKQINDSFGHAVGDEALKVVTQCLTASVRETDTVSRHGGDEFLVLLADVSTAADAARVARKIIGTLGELTHIGEHSVRLTASIGISLYPGDGESPQALIDCADAAMYRAKGHKHGGFVFHDERASNKPAVPLHPLESQQHRIAEYERALAKHERRNAELQEANAQLVLAALDARDLQAAADLLDPARAGTRALTIDVQRVDMAGIIDDAVCLSRHETERRLQTFEVDVPPGPLEVLGDPARLAQVFSNLLTNATMYAQEAGKIRLSAVVERGDLVVAVSDGGIGITAEALKTIFDPFVQDTHAVGFNGGGLGIGLTVVREIVAAHGGRVAATSAGRGLGSQFVVTLPLAPSSSPWVSRVD